MGFTAKAKNSKESWLMGLLLVFFPEDNTSSSSSNNNSTAINGDKSSNTKLFASSSSSMSSSSSSSSSSVTTAMIRRSNSNRLLTKAQSTISICALLVFITLLLFTLSTFEPNNVRSPPNSRRFLDENNRNLDHKFSRDSRRFLSSDWFFFSKMWKRKPRIERKIHSPDRMALQGLGTLYRRGTRAMADLAVAHVSDDVSCDELRLFLRVLHRSGVTARADVVLLFASSPSRKFDSAIRDENESFSELVRRHNKTTSLSSSKSSKTPWWRFDVGQFKAGKKEGGEPLWGKRVRSGFRNDSDESTQTLSYGSVVGFEASELDPENSLSGFLDHVPMSLRRWACYPMLLGRVRRNFKHIMLVDVKNQLVLGDQLGLVRNRSPESVHLFAGSDGSNSKRGKRSLDKTQSHHDTVNPAVITGGARGIRRLSNAMLTEIVRVATAAAGQHKRRSLVTESGILKQLVGNEFLLKNVKLVKSADSVPSVSELSHNSVSFSGHSVVQRGNGNSHELKSLIMKHICSSEVDSSVYRDCIAKS